MPTDCPQRDERMGWFGDRTTGCYGESYAFNNHALYTKWLEDIELEQTEEGSLPDVAPAFWDIRSDNMTWPGVFITAANMLYERYGDAEPIIKHYPAMKKWLAYMKEKYGVEYIFQKKEVKEINPEPEIVTLFATEEPS